MSLRVTGSSKRRPISRLTAKSVFSGFVTACRLAGWPTSRFPASNRSFGLPALDTNPESALLYWLVVQDPDLGLYFELTPDCTDAEYNHAIEEKRHSKASIRHVPPGQPLSCINLATTAKWYLDQWP